MPTYCFVCPECDDVQEVIRPMKDASLPLICGACGVEMCRDYAAQGVNAGNKEYGKPIHSDAMAVTPSQVKEHQRLFPDVKIDSQCRPVLENYQQHKKYAEKRGFIKQPA